MYRKMGFASVLVFLVTLAFAVQVTYAQSLATGLQSSLTRHVHDVTRSGEARPVGRLSPTGTMRLVLVLPLRNQAALEEFLNELYDPSTATYRHYLTVEEFTARYGPTQEDYDAVIRFAEANGLTVVGTSRNRVNVDVTGTVANIEKAFHLNMGLYMHPTENRTFYAPDREPTVNLPFALWHIAGLDNYSIPHSAGLHHRNLSATPNATTGSGPSASFLGSDMRAAYYGGTALTGAGQSLGLLEYYGTDLADLNTYFSNIGQTNHVPVTLLSTDGTSTSCVYPSCDDTEQTLDMTQALGMAPGLSSLVVYVGSSDVAIFNAMATANPLNAQLSSSWTWTPADPNTDNPYFQQFAAQGQNLFQASGDSGAWTANSSIYPADDVYVTSVGGTDLTTSSAGGPWSSETVWVDGGGGVSPDGYAIPSWQTAAANGCSSCSKTLRNGPDVSANANFTFYVCADQSGCTANYYGGTSFAAPMWAGYLALVNQQAVANGGKTVGFINPSLYTIGAGSSYSSDFHDILSGSNGHSATTGYDLATGWGSPHGAGLINALTGGSPSPDFSLSASPSSVSVTRGSNGTSTITITPSNGFTGSVTLSASGLPSGVTAAFNPNPATSTSTVTFTASGTAATGTVTVTATGTSGSLTHTTTITLTVNAAVSPNFSLSASPSSETVTPGTGTSYTATVTSSGGFTGSVSLGVSGLPSGANATFSTNPISGGSGSSTMSVATSTSTPTGSYTLTVTGTSTNPSLTHSTTVTLVVSSTGSPSFSVSASPSSRTVTRGSNTTYTVTVTASNGFNGTVNFRVRGLPSNSSAGFNPSSVTGQGTSTLTVNTNASTTSGTFTLRIRGTSGGVTHSTTVQLVVQ
jgi:subtilase family serine protease